VLEVIEICAEMKEALHHQLRVTESETYICMRRRAHHYYARVYLFLLWTLSVCIGGAMTAADIVYGLVVTVQVEDGACTCLVPVPFLTFLAQASRRD
jgi:hypothetical protein